jgi:hypothetical protein
VQNQNLQNQNLQNQTCRIKTCRIKPAESKLPQYPKSGLPLAAAGFCSPGCFADFCVAPGLRALPRGTDGAAATCVGAGAMLSALGAGIGAAADAGALTEGAAGAATGESEAGAVARDGASTFGVRGPLRRTSTAASAPAARSTPPAIA